MRADKFLSEKFSSRTKAAEAIERGLVLVNGKQIKPSDDVLEGDEVEFLTPEESFVSNGGYKLSKALKDFSFSVQGKVFADLGASTGGFTDCLLQNGAKKVYAVDVGESQLDKTLSSRSEVVVMDNVNARYLEADSFDEGLDGCVIDVSFISLRYVLPSAAKLLPAGGVIFALVKPQFECGKKGVGKSGIVKKEEHPKILSSIYDLADSLSLNVLNVVNAPLREKKNIEYVALFEKRADEGAGEGTNERKGVKRGGIDKKTFLALAANLR